MRIARSIQVCGLPPTQRPFVLYANHLCEAEAHCFVPGNMQQAGRSRTSVKKKNKKK
jgi:hypothetical protein